MNKEFVNNSKTKRPCVNFTRSFFKQIFYKPIATKNLTITSDRNDKQIKATIGEISIIPIGGISFLKGARNISLNALRLLKGSLCHLMFGNQDKSMVINKVR